MKRTAGISIVETIFVIGVIVLMSATLAPLLSVSYGNAVAVNDAEMIQHALGEARTRARGNFGGAASGVYIDTSASPVTVTTYRGASFAARDSAFDLLVPLSSGTTVTVSAPGNDIVFSGSVGTTTPRTITIGGSARAGVIDISAFGYASRE